MSKRSQLVAVGTAIAITCMWTIGCSSQPAVSERTTAPSPAAPVATATPTPEIGATRESAVPLGTSFMLTGRDDGPAGWRVQVDAIGDVTDAVLTQERNLYHGSEEYVDLARPRAGFTYVGVTGHVERVSDAPASPSADMLVQLVTSEGRTIDSAPHSLTDSPVLMNLGEMYAPANAQFTEIFEVPVGTRGIAAITERVSMRKTFAG